jgi:hypothetical protein
MISIKDIIGYFNIQYREKIFCSYVVRRGVKNMEASYYCKKLLKDYLEGSRKITPYKDKLREELKRQVMKKAYEEKNYYLLLRLKVNEDNLPLYQRFLLRILSTRKGDICVIDTPDDRNIESNLFNPPVVKWKGIPLQGSMYIKRVIK